MERFRRRTVQCAHTSHNVQENYHRVHAIYRFKLVFLENIFFDHQSQYTIYKNNSYYTQF